MNTSLRAALLALLVAATPLTAAAGTLTNASVTLSDARVSRPTDVTIRYTTAGTLHGSLGHALSNTSFNGLALTNGSCGADVTIKVNGLARSGVVCGIYTGGNLWVEVPAGTTIPAGATIELVIYRSRATTTGTAGSYDATLRTNTGAGPLDTATVSYVIGSPAAPVPTMSEWALIFLCAAFAGTAVMIQRREAATGRDRSARAR